MKIFFALIFFIFSSAYGATCTTTTRNNYSTSQVLTSSALNADFNQLVTKVNSFDGGCVTDGTLEASALNSTDFATVTNGIFQGCTLSYSDSNTVLIGKCIASVNGNFIKTTSATSVAFGCSGCASDTSSTQYYVYIKSGSSGAIITPLILTTAPNSDGYDNSGNKIVGRFFNNASSAIDLYSLETWSNGGYLSLDGRIRSYGSTRPVDSFKFYFGTSTTGSPCTASPCSYLAQTGTVVTSVTRNAAGNYTVNLSKTYTLLICDGSINTGSAASVFPMSTANSNTISMVNATSATDAYGTVSCEGY